MDKKEMSKFLEKRSLIGLGFFLFLGSFLIYSWFNQKYVGYFNINAKNSENFQEFLTNFQGLDKNLKVSVKSWYGGGIRVILESSDLEHLHHEHSRLIKEFKSSTLFDSAYLDLKLEDQSELINLRKEQLKIYPQCFSAYQAGSDLLLGLKKNFFFRNSFNEELRYQLQDMKKILETISCEEVNGKEILQGLILAEMSQALFELEKAKGGNSENLFQLIITGQSPSNQGLITQFFSLILTALVTIYLFQLDPLPSNH